MEGRHPGDAPEDCYQERMRPVKSDDGGNQAEAETHPKDHAVQSWVPNGHHVQAEVFRPARPLAVAAGPILRKPNEALAGELGRSWQPHCLADVVVSFLSAGLTLEWQSPTIKQNRCG